MLVIQSSVFQVFLDLLRHIHQRRRLVLPLPQRLHVPSEPLAPGQLLPVFAQQRPHEEVGEEHRHQHLNPRNCACFRNLRGNEKGHEAKGLRGLN